MSNLLSLSKKSILQDFQYYVAWHFFTFYSTCDFGVMDDKGRYCILLNQQQIFTIKTINLEFKQLLPVY